MRRLSAFWHNNFEIITILAILFHTLMIFRKTGRTSYKIIVDEEEKNYKKSLPWMWSVEIIDLLTG